MRKPTLVITWGSDCNSRLEEIARTVVETPFAKRTWTELLFLMAGMPIAFIGVAFVGVTMGAAPFWPSPSSGSPSSVWPCGGPGASGGCNGGWPAPDRRIIEEPEPFSARPGFLGWLQSALRDRTGWKAMAYLAIKVPLAIFGVVRRLQPVVGRVQLSHLSAVGISAAEAAGGVRDGP